MEPTPTPVVRILGSHEDEEGNTVHEAVRIDGDSAVPVDLYSRPQRASSSSDPILSHGIPEESSRSSESSSSAQSEDEAPAEAPVGGTEVNEESPVEDHSELDVQVAEATLLLQQNTDVQFPEDLGHLSYVQRVLYRRLVARQRRELEEVD